MLKLKLQSKADLYSVDKACCWHPLLTAISLIGAIPAVVIVVAPPSAGDTFLVVAVELRLRTLPIQRLCEK